MRRRQSPDLRQQAGNPGPHDLPAGHQERSASQARPPENVGTRAKLPEPQDLSSAGEDSRRLSKAKAVRGKTTVRLEEVVIAQSFELEAMMNVLEQKGLVTKAEILEKLKRLRAKTGTDR